MMKKIEENIHKIEKRNFFKNFSGPRKYKCSIFHTYTMNILFEYGGSDTYITYNSFCG